MRDIKKMGEVDGSPACQQPTAHAGEAGAAHVLSMALGTTGLTPAAALDIQRQRVAALRDPTRPESLDELARQLPVLEALFQHFASQALRAKMAVDKARLLRAALNAQQAHARTFALLRGLAWQGKGAAVVGVDMAGDADAGLDSDACCDVWPQR